MSDCAAVSTWIQSRNELSCPDVGAGYRVYFTIRMSVVIVLLAGGDKSSQNADIKRAKKMAKEV
jgi:putative addiction module killer protein